MNPPFSILFPLPGSQSECCRWTDDDDEVVVEASKKLSPHYDAMTDWMRFLEIPLLPITRTRTKLHETLDLTQPNRTTIEQILRSDESWTELRCLLLYYSLLFWSIGKAGPAGLQSFEACLCLCEMIFLSSPCWLLFSSVLISDSGANSATKYV